MSINKLELVFDEAQGTAVVLQIFDDEENLHAGPALSPRSMPFEDAPGRRVSVDTSSSRVNTLLNRI